MPTIFISLFLDANATVNVDTIRFKFSIAIDITIETTGRNSLIVFVPGWCPLYFVCNDIVAIPALEPSICFYMFRGSIVLI